MLDICIPVWGEQYCRQWLRCSLPTLLAAQNLPSVSKFCKTRVVLVTTRRSEMWIRQSEVFHQLALVCEVTMSFIEEPPNSYAGMTNASVTVMRESIKTRGLYVLSLADQVWANGALLWVVRELTKFRGVLSWGAILDRDLFLGRISEFVLGNSLTIEPRFMASVALSIPHVVQRNWIIEDDLIPRTPSSLIWVNESGTNAVVRSYILIAHGLNFGLIPQEKAERYMKSLSAGRVNDDVNTYDLLFDDISQFKVARSSDEVITGSLDSSERESLNQSRVWCRSDSRDAVLRKHLQVHQNWEPKLGRFFFGLEYVIITNPDDSWLATTISASYDLAMRASILGKRQKFVPAIWLRLSYQTRRRLIRLMKMGRVFGPLTKILIGYSLTNRKSLSS